jgi:hypothetical protein
VHLAEEITLLMFCVGVENVNWKSDACELSVVGGMKMFQELAIVIVEYV